MNRKLRGSFASDEGMSVIEVVIAAVILFFVLTAILGLVATTTNMGLSARQRAAATNAISSHIEHIRALDFDEWPDSFPSDPVVGEDGFTVTIETAVYEGDDATRELEIAATVTGQGFTPMTVTRSVVIRDPDSFAVLRDDNEGPRVRYVSPTPPENSTVYGNKVFGGGDLTIAVEAECEESEDMITDLSMSCSSMLLHDGVSSFARVAEWHDFAENPYSQSFDWNTQYVEPDTGESIHEGYRMVSTLVTDSNLLQTTVTRQFYVDNYAPGQPGTPVAYVQTPTETRLSWDRAREIDDELDFPVYAPLYLIQWCQVSPEGLIPAVESWEQPENLTGSAWTHATVPFSRYEFAVASGSNRFSYRPDRPFVSVAEPYVSRPLLSGTATITGTKNRGKVTATTQVAMQITPPTFPVSEIRYDVYRSLSIETLQSTLLSTNVNPTEIVDTNAITGSSTATPRAYYYAVKVTFTPSVYKPGQGEQVVWSNIAGPVPAVAIHDGEVVVAPLGNLSW